MEGRRGGLWECWLPLLCSKSKLYRSASSFRSTKP